MFKNHQKYYENYKNYLLSLEGQTNTTDMENGFATIETFIMNIYGNVLNHKFNGRYSEKEEKVFFVNSSIKGRELTDKLKLMHLGDYMYKEYSYIDTS